MSFTRSTTTTNVHSTLGDYPAVDDGLTAAQLKSRFDSPATGLKTDLNGLMDELENANGAGSLGASALDENDTSDDNVQAKLEKLHQEIQDVVLGDIPDGSITQAKLNETYEATLGKKNSTLQTGLNAEKVGGSTLAQILSTVNNRQSASDQTTTVTFTSTTSTTNKTFTAHSRLMLFYIECGSEKRTLLYDCRQNIFVLALLETSVSSFKTVQIWKDNVKISTGTNTSAPQIKETSYSNGTITLKFYGSQSTSVTVNVRCIALDGLKP